MHQVRIELLQGTRFKVFKCEDGQPDQEIHPLTIHEMVDLGNLPNAQYIKFVSKEDDVTLKLSMLEMDGTPIDSYVVVLPTDAEMVLKSGPPPDSDDLYTGPN